MLWSGSKVSEGNACFIGSEESERVRPEALREASFRKAQRTSSEESCLLNYQRKKKIYIISENLKEEVMGRSQYGTFRRMYSETT